MYEIRRLRTAAERAEAAALVQDRQRWLTARGLAVPTLVDVPKKFGDPQTPSVGLFEDGLLLACMIPQVLDDLYWDAGPCLFLEHIHTLPGHPDDLARLITLWASDCAARLDLPLVRAEMLALGDLLAEPLAGLLRRRVDLGWDLRGAGPGRNGDRAARLDLRAEHRSGLRALIGCYVDLHPTPIGRVS
ncbi:MULTISPECIES: hypothetical protein [unclassified Streptomyces]|uniref:hypothetical protein n=1 Tax=unclassified Streptomyces TaxID=2593676 RepID=UPI00035EB295|nr:hypothetical protein [Streptomyces sp. KhCrAH-43]MYS36800.1 hypothetical protein [Streptomyces sp. SID4920]MYX69271.1 hypothetical protein [Streptomyces sp. SID8373]